MKTLRTPEARFDDLPDFPFEPNYADDLSGYEGLRVHWLDEGARGGAPVFLCLHGEPTWSYLYRRMIPPFVGSGGRVVCPDWLGFGRSDKPVDDAVYSFHFHRRMMLAFIERLDLRNITLVVQDWGGLLGLTIPMEMPERFSRLIVMNTTLATGALPGEAFAAWRSYVAANPDLKVGALMKRACPHLNDAEAAAYDAPFPSIEYKAGVRRFPQLVMTEPGMEGVQESVAALAFWREEWQGQSFMAIGAADPVLGSVVMNRLRSNIRNCPQPFIVEQGGHFLQEWGEDVAAKALESFSKG